MNTELLLKVRDAILEEPRKFDMRSFFNPNEQSPCGTTACIAGHALAIERKWKKIRSGLRITRSHNGCKKVSELAEESLGLDEQKAQNLFYVCYWPSKYATPYENARTPESRAKIAARRINHFIKTKGTE